MSSSGFMDVLIWLTSLGFIMDLLSANALMLEQDLDALLAFHNATDRANLLAWNTNTDPCKWEGITCVNSTIGNNSATRERVFRINLPGVGISGTIPSGILGALNELTVLSLRSNFISGPVPADIVNCSQLRTLSLQRNRFSGPLPWDFSAWPRLVRVDLSFNEFKGGIPKSLSELPRLKILFLQNNSFTGGLPEVQFRVPVEFSVANNQLSGPIPRTLSQLPQRDFTGNNLCGPPLETPCAFVPAPQTGTIPSTEAPARKKPGTRLSLGAILAIVIGDAAALAVLTTLFLLCYWHRQHKQLARAAGAAVANAKNSGSDKSSSDEFRSDYSSSAQGDPQAGKLVFLKSSKRNFKLEDLLRASAEMLGQGCLGTSYRAVLEDGEIVTVKRIKGIDLGSKEFEQKMAALGEFKHENLLSLRAYYYSKTEKLVVTEFVPRGSLALHLHGDDKDAVPLDWSARLRIALGAARGVAYLHEFLLVHGNIKSSNILLSRGLEARVADHGLIQMLSPDGAISASLAGYRAPEVTAIKKFTQQSDVYAFGVFLLELLTGRAPWRTNQRGERIDLPRWVQSVVREEWTEEVFDQAILRFSEEEMVQMLQIALACVATLPGDRPKMKSVVKMIEDVREWASDGSGTRSSEEQQQSYTESLSLDATLPHVEGPLPRQS